VRKRSLPIALAVTALAGGVALTGGSDRSDGARSLNQVEQQAQQARSRESILTGEVSRLTERIRGVQARLAPVQARWQRLNAELTSLRIRRQELTREYERERARLVYLRKALARQQSLLAARLSAAYRRGETSVAEIIVRSGGGVSDIAAARDALDRVTIADENLISSTKGSAEETRITRDRIKANRNEVYRNEQRVAVAEDEARAALSVISAERDRLAAARSARAAALEQVQGDRRELEAEARGLRARSTALARTIAASPVPSTTPVSGNGRFAWPVNGPIVSPFGPRWGRMHEGVDIAAGTGTPIGASGSGTVIVAGWSGGYGNLVVVNHGGIATAYAHMSRINVSVGQQVSTGTTLGLVGCTGHCYGPHVHFEVRLGGGTPVNPVNYL
jgi:murein DD-endopeptidase MepM/ murein hydrolase activator NlpD